MITLEAGDATADVCPADGGRVGSLAVDGFDLLVTGDSSSDRLLWGSYPMVPWAGRLRHGRFTHEGREWTVPCDFPPHAIHGTGYRGRWDLLDAGLDFAELQIGLDWPLGGTAHQHVQLTPSALVCVLTVVAGDRSMPVTIGWHPWFVKPASDRLHFERLFVRDDEWVPSGELVAPPERPWDDCLVGADHPLQLRYDRPGPGGGPLTVTVASDADHWVVYDMPEHATCVEPQTGPPDAFNLGRATVLAPGELLQRTMTISWV